jgi:hypothetical protein
MSEDDLDIWDRVLEQSRSAADTSTKTIDILEGVASKCPEIGPRYASYVESVLTESDLV